MIIILFLILIALLTISAIVSAIETSITGANFVKIETMFESEEIDEKKKKQAEKVLDFKEMEQRIISTMLFLNNIVNIVATTITTILVTVFIKNIPLAVSTAVLTFIILIFCEITPKRIANQKSEETILLFADFVKFVVFVFYPFVAFLSFISDAIARILHIQLKEEEEVYTEDELKTLVDISHEQGILETEETKIIQNALEYGDIKLKDIMVANEKVVFLNIDASYEEALSVFYNTEYTRFPVVDGDLDNVLGILNVKDFLLLKKEGEEEFNLKEIIREPFFLNENVKISSAFKRMQKVFSSLVIVRGDNCKTVGIATLEDILEEIVGEIHDEYDDTETTEGT